VFGFPGFLGLGDHGAAIVPHFFLIYEELGLARYT
jgi:hypothetical protein